MCESESESESECNNASLCDQKCESGAVDVAVAVAVAEHSSRFCQPHGFTSSRIQTFSMSMSQCHDWFSCQDEVAVQSTHPCLPHR